MNGKSHLSTGFEPLLLLAVINFALIKEEIDLNVRHKNHGVGQGAGTNRPRTFRQVTNAPRQLLLDIRLKMFLRRVPRLAKPWYSPKKHFQSDIEEELAACICVFKRLQFQPLADFRSQTAPFPVLKRTLRGVLTPWGG